MSMCAREIIRSLLFGLLVVAAANPVAAQNLSKAETPREINIPAGSLRDALDKLGDQAGVQIVFESSLAEGITVAAVSGTLSVTAALSQLLANTGLRADSVNEKTVILKRVSPSTSNGGPADQMRVALVEDTSGGELSIKDGDNSDGRQITVRDTKVKSDFATNADIPRSINDPQPYYVFDAETIERSGATNVADFLKQRLTMNTVVQTNGELSGVGTRTGNISSINLRGLGIDKTLILINGRRTAGVISSANSATAEYQPDLNGFPLSAIDRIEVLPSSASGIYGGSAIGGVVNVILKRDYTGGEVRLNYDNTTNGNSAGRNVTANYGLSLDGGRTNLSFNAGWSEKRALMLRDRAWIFRENLNAIQSRAPTVVYSNTNPWLGSLPNVTPRVASAMLILKPEYGGTALNTRNTHVPANTAPGTSTAELAAMLAVNAGLWNFDFPNSTQGPTGLLREMGTTPETRSLHASLRRQVTPRLALAADLSWNQNRSNAVYSPLLTALVVPAGAPTNPFTTDVRVRVPSATHSPFTTRSESRSVTLGALAQLPKGWTGALDYTWSESQFDYSGFTAMDAIARDQHLLSGDLNPFVDTLRYPLDLQKYLLPVTYRGANRLHSMALRGSGPLPALPWGQPNLTVGIERRLADTPERTSELAFPISTLNNSLQKYYAREAATDSGYLEALVPLVESDRFPMLQSLELQLSGRSERYQVDTGTPYEVTYYNYTPPIFEYGAPNLNDEAPIFSQANYTSRNYTVGLKYQPMKSLTLRASRATAFLPPTPLQLIKDPLQSTFTAGVNDPQFGDPNDTSNDTEVHLLTGGNPDLKPQNSRSFNAGVIWEPMLKHFSGLRLNAEYYRIEQFDAIGTLSIQSIVDQESVYPERITRDSSGRITLVDQSLVNLYRRKTDGWDLNLDYALETRAGRVSLHAVRSIILHLKNQYSQVQPEYDAVNFPSEEGAVKYKTNATVNWETGPLLLGWTVRYFGSYKQFGAAGGPSATMNGSHGSAQIVQQGSDAIPSQAYHDLLIAYSSRRSFGSAANNANRVLDRLNLQLGVRNVFDKVAPMDAYYAGNYYMSPYGDVRLRSYWLNVGIEF